MTTSAQQVSAKQALIDEFTGMVTSKLNRVKMVNMNVNDDLAVVIRTIAKASNRSKYETMMDNHELSDYKLDSHFKSLALPCEVYVSSDIMDLNLKKSETIEDVTSPTRFIEAQANVLAAFKKTFTGEGNLLDATVETDLNTVLQRMTDGKRCHYSDVAYIPINLSIASELRKKSYFTVDNADMIRLYVDTVLAPALRG